MAQAVVALHREDLLGVLAGQQPESWIASIASVHGPGTSEVTKEPTDRSPAISPASAETAAGAEERLEAGDHQVGRIRP